jgi:uncharacterized surface protein with fasciclin (FAS1) repeats
MNLNQKQNQHNQEKHRIMKKLLTTLTLLLSMAASTFAQTPPEAFSYSAVARDANSNPIANTTIGIQISLRQGSPLGTIVYQENHFVNTDQFGLFNLTVGAGAVQSGVMANIDWAAANYYLQVGMDANGSTNFLNMGTTQLLSVPYALHAKTAGSIVGGGGSGTLASVTTANATNVLATSATLGGNVTASGGELVLSSGVCVSTTANPTVDDVVISMGSGTGAFTGSASNLQSGTTYYVRAYATNPSGTAYGNNVNFTTQSQGSISALDCDNAGTNGSLIDGVDASGVIVGVLYFGGNGGPHSGQIVNSTGVTGLTATLPAGNFANGSNTVVYNITGTPSGSGTANFSLNIGGQSCSLSLTVNPNSIAGFLQSNVNFSILTQALSRPDLSQNYLTLLEGTGPFTFWAPTNDAFQALFTELGVASINDIPAVPLESVLQYHIVNGVILASSFFEGQAIATVQGGYFTISVVGGPTLLDSQGRVALITVVDIETGNGVIHVIDKVLLP